MKLVGAVSVCLHYSHLLSVLCVCRDGRLLIYFQSNQPAHQPTGEKACCCPSWTEISGKQTIFGMAPCIATLSCHYEQRTFFFFKLHPSRSLPQQQQEDRFLSTPPCVAWVNRRSPKREGEPPTRHVCHAPIPRKRDRSEREHSSVTAKASTVYGKMGETPRFRRRQTSHPV